MSEFSDLFGEWMDRGVTLATRRGGGGYGETFDAPHPYEDLLVEESRKRVTGSTGELAISEAQIYVEDFDVLELFTDGSRVTLPSGRVAVVIKVSKMDVTGLLGHGVVYTT